MTPTDFAAWVDHMKSTRGWSARECARRLGCGHNQIGIWRARGAPPYIGLAAMALACSLPPWINPGALAGPSERDAA